MKTLLNAVNEVLKRVDIIAGDAGELTTLADSARQNWIDLAVQIVNEGIDELYSVGATPLPNEQAQATITLVASQQDYTLESDLVQLRFPLIDKTNNQVITEFPGGYNNILQFDTEQDDTGLPRWGAISPVDGKLYLDRKPTSEEAGRVYTYQYDKDLELDDAADEVPFNNAVFRAMVPVWAQIWNREKRKEFDSELFKMNIGRAAGFLTRRQPRTSYSPR